MITRMSVITLLVCVIPARADLLIELRDGTLIKSAYPKDPIIVSTSYGNLSIPLQQVELIDFGPKVPQEQDTLIKALIIKLGSVQYKEREEAFNNLKEMGQLVYPYLYADNSPDNERKTRIAQLILFFNDNYNSGNLRKDFSDRVITKEFTIKGQITSENIEITHHLLGKFKLPMHTLRSVTNSIDRKLVISSVGEWVPTGINLLHSRPILVKANGKMDLYQNSGQYVSGPNGLVSAGTNNSFLCGALVGKCGRDGNYFLVGDSKHVTGTGELFLYINPCAWPNSNENGQYEVEIK